MAMEKTTIMLIDSSWFVCIYTAEWAIKSEARTVCASECFKFSPSLTCWDFDLIRAPGRKFSGSKVQCVACKSLFTVRNDTSESSYLSDGVVIFVAFLISFHESYLYRKMLITVTRSSWKANNCDLFECEFYWSGKTYVRGGTCFWRSRADAILSYFFEGYLSEVRLIWRRHFSLI